MSNPKEEKNKQNSPKDIPSAVKIDDTPDQCNDEQLSDFDGFSINDLQKNFKHLADELIHGAIPTKDLVESTNNSKERSFRNYEPNIFDYLARARTEKECEEIIAYCLAQNEIDEELAAELRERLSKGGASIFGTREPGYYENA